MGDKYRHFHTNGGRLQLDLATAMLAAIASKEKELRELTDSKEVFAVLEKPSSVSIQAKALNEYRTVGKFSMEQMPGCCGVVISYHSQIEAQFRKRGLGTLFLAIREDAAKRAGYTCIMGTVLGDNSAEQSILRKAGWNHLAPTQTNGQWLFINKKTGHNVMFWCKVLSDEE